MSRRFPILVAVALGGCFKTNSVKPCFSQVPPEYAHYVLVQESFGGGVRVLDCVPMPDGEHWAPRCIRVDRASDDEPGGTRRVTPTVPFPDHVATPGR